MRKRMISGASSDLLQKSLFLNQVAFLATFICEPKPNEFGYIEPVYKRFLKIQKYVRILYIKFVIEKIKNGE